MALADVTASGSLSEARRVVTDVFGEADTGTDARALQLLSLAVFAAARSGEGRERVERYLGWASLGSLHAALLRIDDRDALNLLKDLRRHTSYKEIQDDHEHALEILGFDPVRRKAVFDHEFGY